MFIFSFAFSKRRLVNLIQLCYSVYVRVRVFVFILVSLPHGAMGWSAIGDFDTSWSYSPSKA